MDSAALIQSVGLGVVVAVHDADRAPLEPGADQDEVSPLGLRERIRTAQRVTVGRLLAPGTGGGSRSGCVRVHSATLVEVRPAVALVGSRADLEVPGFSRDQRRPRHVMGPHERVDFIRTAFGEDPLGLAHGRYVLRMTPALQVHATVRRQALQHIGRHEVVRVDQEQRLRQLHDRDKLDFQNLLKQLWIDLRLVLDCQPEQTPQQIGLELASVVENDGSLRARCGKRVKIHIVGIRRRRQPEALRDTGIDPRPLVPGVLLSQRVEERERIDSRIIVPEQLGLADPVHLARLRDQSGFACTQNGPREFSEPRCPVVDFLHNELLLGDVGRLRGRTTKRGPPLDPPSDLPRPAAMLGSQTDNRRGAGREP